MTNTLDFILYNVLNENQKKKMANLFSSKQKEAIKKITSSGKRHMQKKKIKQIKHHLYSLGFTHKALQQLEDVYVNAEDAFMKQLAAWELALWHVNELTESGAREALTYLEVAIENVKDKQTLRKATILQVECYERLGEISLGKQLLDERLSEQQHPDLYLAAANLETDLAARTTWINKALATYQLSPIAFTEGHYDSLITQSVQRSIQDGPKVSVILPAFKAEEGIRIAIESILSQTWHNIELLAVDDCSPDQTAAVIKEYAEKDSRVRYLSTPQNSGPYVARNIALQQATGDFVTINDADDWSHAEKIEIQVRHLLEHPEVIANTSEHARLTEEDLKLYRRGNPGLYIFSNMSSLMFRREPVMKEVGFWDSVRFAADGEFKRRLIKVFGKERIMDVKTGPLSLPRQSVSSLTGSSAFGYNGFFMGARQEYVESLEHHHNRAETLYYPYPQSERLFPVPEPMWPKREDKPNGSRLFDVVIAADFRIDNQEEMVQEIKALQQMNKRIGLVQLNRYQVDLPQSIHTTIRELLDGNHVHMLVYGEKISATTLFVLDTKAMHHWQKYIPMIQAHRIHVKVAEEENRDSYTAISHHVTEYFTNEAVWHPVNQQVRMQCLENETIQQITVSEEDWKTMVCYVE